MTLRIPFVALAVGFIASFALPAQFLWMRGNGVLILFALVPLFLYYEFAFEHYSKRKAWLLSSLASFFSAWAIECGFFFWGVSGIKTFLGLSDFFSILMTTFVLGVHALAVVPMFLLFVSIRSFTSRKLPLLGACLMMPLFEHLAPRLFYYTYGSFFSLTSFTQNLLGIGGSAALSVLVFLCSFIAAQAKNLNQAFGVGLAAGVTLFLGFMFPAGRNPVAFLPNQASIEAKESESEFNVLLVQPAIEISKQIPQEEGLSLADRAAFDEEKALANLKVLDELTQNGLRNNKRDLKKVDLVVWPETVIPANIFAKPLLTKKLEETILKFETPVLFQFSKLAAFKLPVDSSVSGSTLSVMNQASASLADIWPKRKESHLPYQKSALMPFGEFLPWRFLWNQLLPQRILDDMPNERDIPKLGNQGVIETDAVSADSLVLNSKIKIAAGICFDGIFPDLAREQVKNGADFIVNMSNLEWMGNSASENVYRSIVRLRALETGRPLLFVNNSGGTAGYDAWGNLLGEPLEHGVPSTSIVSLNLSEKPSTLFVKMGHAAIFVMFLLGFALFMFSGVLWHKT